MNTFKRKSLHAAVLAGLGAVGLAGTANAVNINPDHLGQVLLYPYYTVRNDGGGATGPQYDTLVTLVNTTASTKAVKVRILEGVRSQEVLDFNLYLSPRDVWTGAIVRTGAAAGDGARLVSSDNSCVVPNALFSTAASNTLNHFKNFQYTGAFTDGGDTSLDRTREGYIEIIEMGVVTDPTATAAAKHNSAGIPANCAYFQANDTTLGTAIAAPVGGLYGAGSLINVNSGMDYSYDAVALNNWQTGTNNYTPSSLLTPTVSGGNVTTSYMITNAGNVVSATWLTSRDAVTAALMAGGVWNEYTLESTTSSGTDWVITFPGKRAYTAVGSGAAVAPFNANYSAGQSCDVFTYAYWNREEGVLAGELPPVLPSPLPPGAPPTVNSLCFEANVVTFNSSRNLGSKNGRDIPISSAVGLNGHASILFNQTVQTLTPVASATNGVADAAPQAHRGLPVIGFAVADALNTTVGAAPLYSSYGGNWVHKYSRSIGATP